MTDEEFGRAWAKQQGLAPYDINDGALWVWGGLPRVIHVELDRFCGACANTENKCYSALGAAVRAVHAAVPPLAGGQA